MENTAACPLAPHDQGASFVELFFDLVFVFSVTQVVALLHHGLDWVHVGQAVLVFWLVWWAWTQFTWALNAADTTHHRVELVVLLATAVTFFMSVTLPSAFGERALWFGGSYVLVRLIGLGLYLWVTWHVKSFRKAVGGFAGASLAGLACVLLGAWLGGTWQYVLWGATILCDLWAASRASADGETEEGFRVHPEHFTERHGLFVIIALGEGLIVAAHGLEAGGWTNLRISVALMAVVACCGLWWTYFARAKPALEQAMDRADVKERIELARTAFTFGHCPLLMGVIAFAVGCEKLLAHTGGSAPRVGVWALVVGILLFQGSLALGLHRSYGVWPWKRLGVTLVTSAALIAWTGASAWQALGAMALGMWLIALLEHKDPCPNKAASSQLL